MILILKKSESTILYQPLKDYFSSLANVKIVQDLDPFLVSTQEYRNIVIKMQNI